MAGLELCLAFQVKSFRNDPHKALIRMFAEALERIHGQYPFTNTRASAASIFLWTSCATVSERILWRRHHRDTCNCDWTLDTLRTCHSPCLKGAHYKGYLMTSQRLSHTQKRSRLFYWVQFNRSRSNTAVIMWYWSEQIDHMYRTRGFSDCQINTVGNLLTKPDSRTQNKRRLLLSRISQLCQWWVGEEERSEGFASFHKWLRKRRSSTNRWPFIFPRWTYSDRLRCHETSTLLRHVSRLEPATL